MPPIIIIASVQVQDGKMEDAIAALKEIVPKIKESEPGCLEYIPHTVKEANSKNTILFYEKYEDEAAMKLHMANLGKNMKKFNAFLAPGMDIKTCYEIL